MKAFIEVDLDGAAFEDHGEVFRVLQDAAEKVLLHQTKFSNPTCRVAEQTSALLDSNGNSCGSVKTSRGCGVCGLHPCRCHS